MNHEIALVRCVTRASVACAASLALLAAPRAGAQGGDSAASADSVLRSRGLAGSMRAALDLSASRSDGGQIWSYGASALAEPFVTEHLQVGVVPGLTVFGGAGASGYHAYRAGLVANYVFGGDSRWRGFAGGYAEDDGATVGANTNILGGQAGALFFLDPAVALRGQITYRRNTAGPSDGFHYTQAAITLDPYLFGRASDLVPAPAGLGVLDLAGYVAVTQLRSYSEWDAAATVAPYLTRWAQIGADGEIDRFVGGSAHQLRGFGRLYLPLTTRTQPYAEGFAETSTFDGSDGGLTSYGGTVGVREMLNARVALDVGLRRSFVPPETLNPGTDYAYTVHWPASTGLVVGLMTRLGSRR